MVIHDLDLAWPRLAVRPFEADAPLPVDADGILFLAVATECFQPIAWHGPQRLEGWRCMQDRQPLDGLLFKALEIAYKLTVGKTLCLPVQVSEGGGAMNSVSGMTTSSCELCVALDEAEQFARRCLPGGWLLGILVRLCGSFWSKLAYTCQFCWKASCWLCRPAKDSFRIIELLAILIAIFAFFLELGNRQEEREVRAWQLLTTKASGNSGKVGALEFLNREEQWAFTLKWWPLPQSTERLCQTRTLCSLRDRS